MKKKYFGFITMLFFAASISSYAQAGGYLDCNPASSLVETSGTVSQLDEASAFTLEAMVRPASIGLLSNIFSKIDISTNRIALQITATGALSCIVANGANTYKTTTGLTLQANTWYHIAMVYDGTQATASNRIALYINGTAHTTFTNGGTLPTTAPTTAGVTFKVDGGGFTGDIDEVRVWNAALTSTAISAWKGVELDNTHPNYANLKLYWNFNEYTSTSVAKQGLATTYDGTIANALYVNSTLGIRDIENRLSPVFPNPFNSELNVTLNLSENSDVLLSLYDLEGKIIKEISKKNDAAGTNVYTMPTESIPNGLYLLKIMTNDKVQTCKIIKE